jgi:hypothetical protein
MFKSRLASGLHAHKHFSQKVFHSDRKIKAVKCGAVSSGDTRDQPAALLPSVRARYRLPG